MDKKTQDTQNEYNKVKLSFEESFKEFHKKVFTSKILDQNKSVAVKNTEHEMVEKLIKSAMNLDSLNVSEGLWALTTVAVRELLLMRDRTNELEYELFKMKRDFLSLEKDLGIKHEEKKVK